MSLLPDIYEVQRIIRTSLDEDVGSGDITTNALIAADALATVVFKAREPMVMCGGFIPERVYAMLGGMVKVEVMKPEGSACAVGDTMVKATGNARILLTGERVALNLMQRISSVATTTEKYVAAVRGTRAIVMDTRKTMPGLRALDKYAVRVGGGHNHRMRLDEMVLIKDNHIAVCGSIEAAVKRTRENLRDMDVLIEVECDTLAQLKEAIAAGVDRVLLDNMSIKQLREAVKVTAGKIPLEASGGISLETIREIAETGVDYISVGRITHSALSVDIGLDVEIHG